MSECGLFWVGGVDGGVWSIIVGGWGWVKKCFGWVGVSGDEWGWVHCLIILIIYNTMFTYFKTT